MKESDSVALSKGPCSSCGSSDGNVLYDDGHHYCFVCATYTPPNRDQPKSQPTQPKDKRMADMIPLEEIEFIPLTKRKLDLETCRKWHYGIATFKGVKAQVACYKDDSGRVIAQKVRLPNKEFVFLGNAKSAGLYGQHLWRDGGKKVVITEGEIDAMSVSQVEDHKWPVVSLPNGASNAVRDIRKALQWLETFDEVILMFDQDEPHYRADGTVYYPGQEAAAECAALFTPGKCKIAKLPLKDANEMLKAGRGAEIVKAKFEAKTYRPDGIVSGTEIWDRLVAIKPNNAIEWPYQKLQQMTRGARKGEVITFTSGSGMGKSEVIRQVYTGWLKDPEEVLGIMHLEESIERSAYGMIGFVMGKRVHLEPEKYIGTDDFRAAFEATVGSGRVFMYDHFGSTDSENLFDKIRFMARGLGCTTIVLDHISIVVSGIEDGDERRIIDNLMTRLATMAQELNVRIVIVSHLRKSDGTPHEEGGRVTMDHLRGSAAIKQLSHTIIALERNQQDEERKHLTLLRVLKCRFTGMTGEADWLLYDTDTGLLHVTDPAFLDETKPSEFVDETQQDY